MAVMLTSAEHKELLAARDERDRLRGLFVETVADFKPLTWQSRLIARHAGRRPPDFVIGGAERPYLRRWFVIPRNRFFNVYLHEFLRSDDDRAHHTHPWAFNASVILRGEYTEHQILAGGLLLRTIRKVGQIKVRWGGAPHRVELHDGHCWTLFLTGPRVREWGFLCMERGFVHWRDFTSQNGAEVGKGCDA